MFNFMVAELRIFKISSLDDQLLLLQASIDTKKASIDTNKEYFDDKMKKLGDKIIEYVYHLFHQDNDVEDDGILEITKSTS